MKITLPDGREWDAEGLIVNESAGQVTIDFRTPKKEEEDDALFGTLRKSRGDIYYLKVGSGWLQICRSCSEGKENYDHTPRLADWIFVKTMSEEVYRP